MPGAAPGAAPEEFRECRGTQEYVRSQFASHPQECARFRAVTPQRGFARVPSHKSTARVSHGFRAVSPQRGFRTFRSCESTGGFARFRAVSPSPGFAWGPSRKHRPSAWPPRLQSFTKSHGFERVASCVRALSRFRKSKVVERRARFCPAHVSQSIRRTRRMTERRFPTPPSSSRRPPIFSPV